MCSRIGPRSLHALPARIPISSVRVLFFFFYFLVTGPSLPLSSPPFVPFNPRPSFLRFLTPAFLVPPPTRGPHRDILSVLFAGTSGVRTKGTHGALRKSPGGWFVHFLASLLASIYL